MNGVLGYITKGLIWAAIVVYLVFAARMCAEREARIRPTALDITVSGSAGEVRDTMIFRHKLESVLFRDTVMLRSLNTDSLKGFLETDPYIRTARIYYDMEGNVKAEIEERVPQMRFKLGGGFDFYVSDDDWIYPAGTITAWDVPIVTGNFALPFQGGYSGYLHEIEHEPEKKQDAAHIYLLKLINFVRLVTEDTFWNSQIVQIDVAGRGNPMAVGSDEDDNVVILNEPQIRLIPRIGRHIVFFGTPDNAAEKLNNLMLFYRKIAPAEGWDKYRTVDVRYRDQLVCTE